MKEDFLTSYFDAFNKAYGVSKQVLSRYYNETVYGGYPEEDGGAVWSSEAKALYCMLRITKPKKILEIGNYKGVSTNSILHAVEKNKCGIVHLVDIEENLVYEKLHNQNFERYIEDSHIFLDKELDYDFYVHDGCHEYQHVKKELELMIKNTTVDFNIWSHDYFKHVKNQCEVKRAWDEVEDKFEDIYPVIDSVSDCGFLMSKYKVEK